MKTESFRLGKDIIEKKIQTLSMAREFFELNFTIFVTYSLRVIVSLIGIVAVGQAIYYGALKSSVVSLELILLYIIMFFGIYYGIKKKISINFMFCIILLIGLILRLLYVLSVDSVPVSDFSLMYEAAEDVVNGNYASLMGTAYFGRFPHLIIFILYLSQMIKWFGINALGAIKSINIIFSTSTIAIIFFILKEIYDDYRKILIGTFLSAVMPASICYTAVCCSENLAIPFYLGSIYLFILVIKKQKKSEYLLLSGMLLLVGHLFRMVAQIMIIAYIMYIIIYEGKSIFEKVKSILYILLSFIVPFVIVSNLLVALNVTDRKLWSGSEPYITSILKGSNIEHYGTWNEEDAKFINDHIDDRDYLEKASKDKIIQRYTTTPVYKLVTFALVKITFQWKDGDSGGAFWAQKDLSDDKIKIDINNNGILCFQLFYAGILFFTIKGLLNKNNYINNKIVNLFYIIFCGYGMTFLIIETQQRYAFIINWVFIILALAGFTSKDKGKFA